MVVKYFAIKHPLRLGWEVRLTVDFLCYQFKFSLFCPWSEHSLFFSLMHTNLAHLFDSCFRNIERISEKRECEGVGWELRHFEKDFISLFQHLTIFNNFLRDRDQLVTARSLACFLPHCHFHHPKIFDKNFFELCKSFQFLSEYSTKQSWRVWNCLSVPFNFFFSLVPPPQLIPRDCMRERVREREGRSGTNHMRMILMRKFLSLLKLKKAESVISRTHSPSRHSNAL